MRNVRVNRSVIGQQPALSSNNAPTLNNTLAPPGRERGTGEVAGDITIQEATVQASSESNNETEVSRVGTPSSTPTRRVAPNDGRRGRNTRPRNHNMRFTPHISPHLPPSTGNGRSINMERMEHGYNTIADSINNLAYQQRIRTRIDINRDIQQQIHMRCDLERSGASAALIESYTQTIQDLQEERVLAGEYEQYMSSRIQNMISRDGIRDGTNVSNSDSNLQSDSVSDVN